MQPSIISNPDKTDLDASNFIMSSTTNQHPWDYIDPWPAGDALGAFEISNPEAFGTEFPDICSPFLGSSTSSTSNHTSITGGFLSSPAALVESINGIQSILTYGDDTFSSSPYEFSQFSMIGSLDSSTHISEMSHTPRETLQSNSQDLRNPVTFFPSNGFENSNFPATPSLAPDASMGQGLSQAQHSPPVTTGQINNINTRGSPFRCEVQGCGKSYTRKKTLRSVSCINQLESSLTSPSILVVNICVTLMSNLLGATFARARGRRKGSQARETYEDTSKFTTRPK